MRRHRPVPRRALALLRGAVLAGALLVAVLVGSGPASAQSGEHISAYDTDLTVESDGGLLVRETIVYDFASTPRHGITRVIPVQVDYPPVEHHDRVFPIDVLSVTATDASADYETSEDGGDLEIRVGDPDRTVTGAHTYVITYRVRGAYNGFADHDELVWNVIGTKWMVPITTAAATVRSPAAIGRVNCTAGLYGSNLPCGAAVVDGTTASFSAPQFGLGPYQGMTVTVELPKGTVPEPVPILEERLNLTSAFRVTAATGGISAGLLVVLLGTIAALVFAFGRDRCVRGSAVDAAFATGRSTSTPGAPEERAPIGGEHETPVEFVPPDGLRPGEVGTLVDFRANPLDVTATIVDLAVRGYLTVEETDEPGLFRSGDWKLTRTPKPDDDLLTYERKLLAGIFRDGEVVQLSELHNTFATRMASVQKALMTDALQHKWFVGKPSTVRALWVLAGLVLLGVGIALTVGLAITTHAGLIGVPVVIAGVALVAAAHWMPHRTAKGYAALRRVDGFRRFIDESEKERARFAERKNLFSEYLPYAVVFGATKKWANAFAGLGDEPPDTSSWYVGTRAFNYLTFSSAIDSFSVSSAGTLTSAPSTSGSSGFSGGGFSGGGGGGGGGGSW